MYIDVYLYFFIFVHWVVMFLGFLVVHFVCLLPFWVGVLVVFRVHSSNIGVHNSFLYTPCHRWFFATTVVYGCSLVLPNVPTGFCHIVLLHLPPM